METIKSKTLCPTCGSEVKVQSADGTHFYVPDNSGLLDNIIKKVTEMQREWGRCRDSPPVGAIPEYQSIVHGRIMALLEVWAMLHNDFKNKPLQVPVKAPSEAIPSDFDAFVKWAEAEGWFVKVNNAGNYDHVENKWTYYTPSELYQLFRKQSKP